jgi:tetrahydromethanopterin S-methyltransferase subunit B
MNEYVKVKDHLSLVRDPSTGAILNTSKAEYEEYMKAKKKNASKSERVEKLETDVNGIKNDLYEIKSLLLDLARKQD